MKRWLVPFAVAALTPLPFLSGLYVLGAAHLVVLAFLVFLRLDRRAH